MMISVFLTKEQGAKLRKLADEMETSLSIAVQVIVDGFLEERDE